MIFDLNELDNTLIICPNDYKEKVLESFNNEKRVFDVSFMSLKEYKDNYFYKYDIDAVKYLVDQGFSPDNAKEILENIKYVDDKNYNVKKLDILVEYKKELENKGLLHFNDLFKAYLASKNVIVAGYGKLNSYNQGLIIGSNVKILEDDRVNKKYVINEFENIEEEVEFLYDSIYDLLATGKDINNIFVLNGNDDYKAYFKRFNKHYNFSVIQSSDNYVIGTDLANTFIEMLQNDSKEVIYEYLKKQENEISKLLISLLNKYVNYEICDVRDLIIQDLKNLKYTQKYTNVVKCIEDGTIINKNDYVFLIGFNDSVIHMKKDTDYITDDIKPLLSLPSTDELNEIKKENYINYISNIDNLVISYCKNSPFKSYNKQILLDECEYKNNVLENNYSDELNKIKYAVNLDKLRKFNDIDDSLQIYMNTYGKNNYLAYNNKFKGLSDKQTSTITNQINYRSNNDLTLSYSSMNNYFECAFKYYLNSVLKLKEFEGTYYTKLGTVCHAVLEDLYNDKEFDFEVSWDKQIKIEEEKCGEELFVEESEKYFAHRIKEELKQDIEIVKQQNSNSLLNKYECENNFTCKVDDRINFTGFIDKLMYKETDDEILACVIDYKTSKSIEIDKEIMKYGLSLQLPSYLFLINHSAKFNKKVKFAGLYIQHLINYNNKYKNSETSLSDIKNDSMKLDGLSSINADRVACLDINLNNSQKSASIGGITVNKDGSLRKSGKLCPDEQFEEMDKIVENCIKMAGNEILKGNFEINPKEIDGINVSCRYCEYAPICYKRANDLKFISTSEEEQQHGND